MPLARLFLRLFLCARRRARGKKLVSGTGTDTILWALHGPGAFQTPPLAPATSAFRLAYDRDREPAIH